MKKTTWVRERKSRNTGFRVMALNISFFMVFLNVASLPSGFAGNPPISASGREHVPVVPAVPPAANAPLSAADQARVNNARISLQNQANGRTIGPADQRLIDSLPPNLLAAARAGVRPPVAAPRPPQVANQPQQQQAAAGPQPTNGSGLSAADQRRVNDARTILTNHPTGQGIGPADLTVIRGLGGLSSSLPQNLQQTLTRVLASGGQSQQQQQQAAARPQPAPQNPLAPAAPRPAAPPQVVNQGSQAGGLSSAIRQQIDEIRQRIAQRDNVEIPALQRAGRTARVADLQAMDQTDNAQLARLQGTSRG